MNLTNYSNNFCGGKTKQNVFFTSENYGKLKKPIHKM